MISKTAVKEFLARPLRDLNLYKNFTPAELTIRLAALNPPPVWHTKPRHHQRVSFLVMAKFKYALLLLDMGLGKTKLVLDAIHWRGQGRQGKCRALVVVPGVANVQAWEDEGVIHRPELTMSCISMSGADARQQAFNADVDVVVITYAGLLRMCSKPAYDKKGRTDGWDMDKRKVDAIAKQFQMLVLDECEYLQTPGSLPYRVCNRLTNTIPMRYGLTGTIIAKNAEKMWGQFHVIDKGETLGETVGMFRAVFCKEKYNPFKKWPDHVFDNSKAPLLHQMMLNRAIRYDEAECNDMPECVFVRRQVKFTEEVWQYYDKLLGQAATSKGNFELLKSAYQNMRYLLAGYLVYTDPEGDRTVVKFKNNPKMDEMIQVFSEIKPDRKVLVFCEYKNTGEIICERLRDEKIKALRLYSKTPDKIGVMQRFKQDPTIRALVMSSAGARGLNLQEANYVFFYETPTNPATRKQEYKRADRQGQTRRVFVVDFVVKNSLDISILRAIEKGDDLFDAVVNGRASLTV